MQKSGYATVTSEDVKTVQFTIPPQAIEEQNEDAITRINLENHSGADLTIKGLKVYKVGIGEANYEQGYQSGYNDAKNQIQSNNAQNYNNGYQAGLAAGRAEGSESSNFGDLFTGIFGSLLSFFLTVGNGVTLWNMSLLQIVISFVAIFVIVKVVKNLV